MGGVRIRRAARQQPQGGVSVALNNPLLRNKNLQALVLGTQPVNLATGVPLKVAGTRRKVITPTGLADSFGKDWYQSTEVFPVVGTQNYVLFWHGRASSNFGTAASNNADSIAIGTTSNQMSICTRFGNDRTAIRQDGSTASTEEWGALYNWDGNPQYRSAGEVMPKDVPVTVVVVRNQSGMYIWRDGKLLASFPGAPRSLPAAGLVFGSFIENDVWRSASDLMLGGLIFGDWSPDDVRSFCANQWQLFNGPATVLSARAVADTSLTGVASMIAAAYGTLSTAIRLTSAAASRMDAVGALSSSISLAASASSPSMSSAGLSTASSSLVAVSRSAAAATVTLSTEVRLGASSIAATSASTVLDAPIFLTASASSTSTSSASLSIASSDFAAVSVSPLDARSALSTGIRLSFLASTASSASAALEVGGSVSAAVSSSVSARATLGTYIDLVAVSTTYVGATVTFVVTANNIDGRAISLTKSRAALSTSLALVAAAQSVSSATAELLSSIPLVANDSRTYRGMPKAREYVAQERVRKL